MSDDVSTFDFTSQTRPLVAKTLERALTTWRPSDDSGKSETGQTCVEVRIAEIEELDAYDTVLRTTPVLQHRFWDSKKNKIDPDIATTPIVPELMLDQRDNANRIVRAGLKTRFGSLLADYEGILKREGKALPLNLLGDTMYPDLILTLRSVGITTAQAFVAMSNEELGKMRDRLRREKNETLANRIDDFQARTADRLRRSGFEVPQKTVTEPKKSSNKAA